MSTAHRNPLYYQWWSTAHPECLLCGARGEQFHHFQLVGATRYAGLLPRRASVYNAALICARCHRRIHEQSEAEVVREVFGGQRLLYATMMSRHHEFMDYVSQQVSAR